MEGKVRCLGVVVLTAMVFAPMARGELWAPAYQVTTNRVEADVTESARVVVDGEGLLVKGGAATWTLPTNLLDFPWTAALEVREGTMELGFGTAAGADVPAAADLPASITAKALLWVDASDTTHIAATDGAVDNWYDRRETSTSSPRYCRARTSTTFTAEKPTQAQLEGGAQAIYFGGVGSGQAMEFILPSGSRYSSYSTFDRVMHVFAVNCISNSHGVIFASWTATPSPFRPNGNSMSAYYFESGTTWPAMANGRAYLNGERVDGTLTTVRAGLQLLEAEPYHNVACRVDGFYVGNARDKNGSGGDYLCEAIAFTNVLSEAERLQVSAYLMAKWLPGKEKRVIRANVAKDATLTVNAGAQDVDTAPLAVTGEGTIAKTGTGGYTFYNTKSAVFDGAMELAGGDSATLRSPIPLKVGQAGTLTAENAAKGPKTTFAANSGSTLVKAGNDVATIRALPAGVERLQVEGGTLAMRGGTAFAEDRYTEIPIRNAGFEDFAAVIAGLDGKAATDGVLPASALKVDDCGWEYYWNNGSTATGMDWERWTGAGSGMDGATRSAWNQYSHPPEGKCALMLRASGAYDAIARSAPFALEAGTYELRVMLSGRQEAGYLGQIFRARLVGGSDVAVKAEFGDFMYTDFTKYVAVRMRARNVPAGASRFEFRSLGGRNGLIVLDDVHLYKVEEGEVAKSTWKIPGGDFETDSFSKGSDLNRLSVDHTVPGWTFEQSASWTDGRMADVGVTTICVTNTGAGHGRAVQFNDSRKLRTGSMELCFARNNCAAETTFTPPAGTWQLRGDIARFGSYGVYPSLKATITIGGESTELGTLKPTTRLMGPAAWPRSFTVDGSTAVTLRLDATGIVDASSTSANGILLDDLVLTGATDVELFKGGEMATVDTSESFQRFSATSVGGNAGIIRLRRPSEAPAAFGVGVVSGTYMATIENLSGIYQDVYFPFPGRYRMSFYAHSRLNDKTGSYQPNPLRAWIAKDGVTNVVGYADTYNSDWVQRVFDFDVAEAGEYRVALQGRHNPEDVKHIHEAHVDMLSLRQISAKRDATPPFTAECRISVAEGARLEVNFEGTNTVRALRLGGVALEGIVRAEDHPQYLAGAGCFNVVPTGTAIFFR